MHGGYLATWNWVQLIGFGDRNRRGMKNIGAIVVCVIKFITIIALEHFKDML